MPGAENAARTSRLRPIFFTTRLRVRIPNPKICRRRAHSSPTAPSIAGTRSGRRHHRDSKSARSRRNPGQSDARPVDRAVARAERTNNAKHRGNFKQRDEPMTQMLSPKEQSELNDRLTGAASDGDAVTVQTLLAHGADVHARDDEALCWAACNGHTETVKVLQEAIKSHNTQRLELERRQNPLYAGTGLIFAKSRPEDVEVLLRDAIADRE